MQNDWPSLDDSDPNNPPIDMGDPDAKVKSLHELLEEGVPMSDGAKKLALANKTAMDNFARQKSTEAKSRS